MLNIISKSIYDTKIRGPKKVVDNLIKGLEIIKYPYVINQRLDACDRLWIHDDIAATKKISSLPSDIKVILGPNIFVHPNDIPASMDISRAILIEPSEPVKKAWLEIGYDKSPIDVWPAGIDTDAYKPSSTKKDTVLLYFKQREKAELEKVKNELAKQNIPYVFFSYGSYQEAAYREALSRTKYIVWLGCYESQGFALEEALSANIPILVIEKGVFESSHDKYSTSAPYWSPACGIKIQGVSELKNGLMRMEKEYMDFSPRSFILENLALEKQARAFLSLYEKHFGLKISDGFHEKIAKKGLWKNALLIYRIWFKMKELIKNVKSLF